MRILLSFENFLSFGGTETYNLTLAHELERLGHDAAIYSPNHGEMAERARDEGTRVLTGAQLPTTCDLVLASDAATCHELAGRYPDAVIVLIAHSADHMLQAPPQLVGSCHAVVVLNDRVRRAIEARAWHAPILRLRQPLAIVRYASMGSCRPSPRSALVSTNYVDGPRARVIESACRASGLRVDWIGATTQPTTTPELAIADADLIIGLGRSALEAMAAGRAAYVYGVIGGDGWVTPERYAAMEADGFAGTAFPEVQIDAKQMTADFRAWTETMGEYNRDLASAHHNAREHAVTLLGFVRDLTSASTPVTANDEFARLIRLHWQMERRAVATEREVTRLRSELAERDRTVAAFHEQLVARQAEYELLRGTRRYRLAARMAAPLDRWRDGRGQ